MVARKSLTDRSSLWYVYLVSVDSLKRNAGWQKKKGGIYETKSVRTTPVEV